jgi:hypothetical protein
MRKMMGSTWLKLLLHTPTTTVCSGYIPGYDDLSYLWRDIYEIKSYGTAGATNLFVMGGV